MASIQAKFGISALVTASLAAPIVLQFQANQRLKQEVMALRQQSVVSQGLREEVEGLTAQARSSESLRARERTELVRLRGELAALKTHETKSEVASKNKAPTQAASDAVDAMPAGAGKLIVAEDLQNVGFAAPSSTYQTLEWAKLKGDTNVIFNALAWADEHSRGGIESIFAAAPESVRARYGSADGYILSLFNLSEPKDERHTLISSRIVEENISGEEAVLQVEHHWADGSTTTGPMRYVRIGDGWRQALDFTPPEQGKMSVGLQAEEGRPTELPRK